ncbi:LacI family transcriptional regulator [Suicoccus acidiformans]|uniref:LacI family transcriptional regulator n=1 Tax=Suicoccus acidiformans TaxID=2036206 RepID=A0A347WKW4_9LACT|nr:LacI family DNA-binding transcriptional regulator [Suicoccus acidiformans]AXY25721.1 LacI family transcriptional regulator [Suicoccus acidiformans]
MATIKDVAKLANVSVGSVSKYINGHKVKDTTAELIQNAIDALNYEPNIYAQGLKTNRTFSVVLIIPTVWDPFYSELTYYIEKYLEEYDTKLIICNTKNDLDKELKFITMARQNKVDGIIAITYSNVDEHVPDELPVISIDRSFSKHSTFITSDNYKGGEIAAQKLQDAGSSELFYFGQGSKIENETINRLKGFQDYCEQYSLNYKVYYQKGRRHSTADYLSEFADDLQEMDQSIGVFTDTDTHAWMLIDELSNRGLKVPEDIQIIGFDGSKSSQQTPTFLSSIRQNVNAIAKESVQQLMLQIEEDHFVPKKIIIPVEFIQGKTTFPSNV